VSAGRGSLSDTDTGEVGSANVDVEDKGTVDKAGHSENNEDDAGISASGEREMLFSRLGGWDSNLSLVTFIGWT
jgi:hypothetical protein